MNNLRHVVIPGQVIATSSGEGEGGFLRGHGTYIEVQSKRTDSTIDDEGDNEEATAMDIVSPLRLKASVSGTVERVNKLISVIPFAPTVYSGQKGDLVVGRITSVGPSRWKVSLGPGCREASLPLSGVNLPYGVQRKKNEMDALGMRTLFREGDLLSAEVQQIQHSDGVLILHTRSLKYGKLENGCFIQVYPSLIPRRKQHFSTLQDIGVNIILGTNGWIWLQRMIPKEWKSTLLESNEDDSRPLAETLQFLRLKHANTPLLPDERKTLVRVRNLIEAYKLIYKEITPESLLDGLQCVQDTNVVDITSDEIMLKLAKRVR